MKTIVKRLFIAIVFVASSSLIKGQIKTCGYYDGYWSEWKNGYCESVWGGIDYTLPYEKVNGNYSGFCIHQGGAHPSEYSFKFQISNYIEPTKKVKKEHLKSNQWFEYRGIVEYYVDDECPTAKAIIKACYGHYPCLRPTQAGAKKRTANATIKIAPYKDHPKVYNIWFEDVGVGIDLGTLYFVQ